MNTNNDIAIRVKNISKKYFKKTATGNSEEFYALKNVSFEVKKGEVLGIIGTNGSGKSTLLKILSGVTKPTEGQVEINGTVASILDVGTGFHPDLSGRENVYLRGELLGMTTKEIDSVFHDIVEFSGVEEFIETSVKHYSSGMFLRLAFSIMIHLKSDIMLLDEVMSVGDAAFRNKTMEYLNANSLSQNRTILLISHSFQEIMNNSSQVIELSSGKIAQQGLPEKLLSYYQKNNQIVQNKSTKEYIDFFEKLELDCYSNENKTTAVEIDKAFTVKINAIKKENVSCQLAIRIRDVLNNIVFVTSYLQDNQFTIKTSDQHFELEMNIPAKYFNHGLFYFDIVGMDIEKGETLFRYFNANTIEMELGEISNDWLKRSFGPVRPFFKWTKSNK